MGKVACYNKKRVTVEKSHFISTENMRQNCNGIDFYNDSTTVDGIGFSENDILIANIRPYLKKAWEAEFDGACSTDVLSINPTNINADFLFHCIEKDDFFNYVMSAAKGSKMPRGDKQHIMEYAISFPSVPEQEKISAFIDLLTKMIAAQSKLVETLKLYKRGVSSRIFSQKLSFSENAKSWKETTIGEVCTITMGQSPDSDSYNTENKGLPLVQGNADMKNRITHPLRYTSAPTKTAENGDVILSVRAPVGTAGRANQKVCLGRGVCSINGNNNDFLYHYFVENETYWKRVEQGGTFTAISGSDIAEMPILLPTNEEIDKIAYFLNSMDSKIFAAESTLEMLLQTKSALLQQMFI